MRLKKLKIFGFKSFAERVVLDFGTSIVGIVGPNGCGKSNIVDAFRWVLGEQSAKSMRGEKMHDVLFAGTERRKALNIAEVSVTLTEIGDELPIPYDEITITRRLHRSGESEYLLNGESVRLRDLQSLFMGSGIGKNAFSVFEQGKLDQVIHLSPLERRSIFDECAGIGRFLQRKRESLRKLDQVMENYHRVKDIHEEVDKRARLLKRQAAQAKRYQDSRERLAHLEKALLLGRYEAVSTKEADFGKDLQGLQEEVEEARSGVKALEKQIVLEREDLEKKEREAHTSQAAVYRAESHIKIKEAELNRHTQRLEEMQERVKRIAGEIKELRERRKAAFKTVKESEKRVTSLRKQKEAAERMVEKKRADGNALEEEIRGHREKHKCLQKESFELLQEESRLQTLSQQTQHHVESAEQRIQDLKRSLKEKRERLADLKKESQEKRAQVQQLSKIIDSTKEELKKLSEKRAAIQKRERETQEGLDALGQEIVETGAREKALIRLREDLEGFSSGAKELLKESRRPKSPLFGKLQALYEYFTPKEALSSAMRSYAHTLVVKTEKEWNEVLSFAQTKGLQDFSLLCLEHLGSVTCQKHFTGSVVVIESFVEAQKRGVLGECVTRDGCYIDHKRVLFQSSGKQGASNTFLRESELETLGRTLKSLQSKRGHILKELEKLQLEGATWETKQATLDEEHRKKEMVLIQENFALQTILQMMGNLEDETERLEKEKDDIMQTMKEKGAALARLSQDVEKRAQQKKQLFAEAEVQEKSLEKALLIFEKAAEERREKEATFQNILNEWQAVTHEIRIFEAKDQESQEHQKKMTQELEQGHKLIEECREAMATLEQSLSQDSIEFTNLKERAEGASKLFLEEKEQVQKKEIFLGEKRESLASLEQSLHQQEVACAEDASLKKGIEQEFQDRFGLTIEEAKEQGLALEDSFEKTEEGIRKLRYQLERGEAVNLTAIEESKQEEKRAQYLESQLSDLEAAKKDLEKLIAELDSESRKIFKTTFEKIKHNFQKNFQILFSGGAADLKFTDSTDVLEAGVEIIAKPPGKQMRSISLLSGGEKCLTALALLFSIFEEKPAPFCILDEVDAPLDDTNIERFTQVLTQFITQTQFIIVTHNKKTMAIADVLFGVSMEEKGVSKLISLAFEKKGELKETIA